MDYKEYNDNELLYYVNEANEEATEIIYKKYEPLINNLARKIINYCKNSGVEINDLVQEGMLGLSKALEQYKDNKDASFYTFAKTCIERKMISAAIAARRQKHKILNDSLSIESTDEEGHNICEYLLSDDKSNPETMLLNIEREKDILNKASHILTDFEIQVFELKINGFNYKEISEVLDRDVKAIDNALQRIKTKLKKNINIDFK